MYTNVNLAAPIGVLALLGTAFLFVLFILAFVIGIVSRKSVVRKWSQLGALVLFVSYFGCLLLFSFASSEKVLARGEEKYFCELDCHLAYSVVDVQQFKTIGDPPHSVTASGVFYAVTIKTRFDETTISARRGNGPLAPNPRLLTITDDQGHKYFPSQDADKALGQSAGPAITTPQRPSESYLTTVVFDLPSDIRNPTLLINEGDSITHFIIGHENSALHKKTRFQL